MGKDEEERKGSVSEMLAGQADGSWKVVAGSDLGEALAGSPAARSGRVKLTPWP